MADLDSSEYFSSEAGQDTTPNEVVSSSYSQDTTPNVSSSNSQDTTPNEVVSSTNGQDSTPNEVVSSTNGQDTTPNEVVSSTKQKMLSLLNKLPDLGKILDLKEKIGKGTFSNVYLASSKYVNEEGQRDYFAVKHLIPTIHPNRVVRELICMQAMGGRDNVVGVCMCLRKNDCITFIMPYQQHDKFSSYVMEMQIEETRIYLKELLIALRRVHKFGFIHRDVKPSNFLYSRKHQKFLLVDFGLAEKVGEFYPENTDTVKDNTKRKIMDEGGPALNVLKEIQKPGVEAPSYKNQTLQNLDSNIPVNAKKAVHEDPFSKRHPLGDKPDNIKLVPSLSDQAKKMEEKLFAKPRAPNEMECTCDGKPQVCNTCLSRKPQMAPRAPNEMECTCDGKPQVCNTCLSRKPQMAPRAPNEMECTCDGKPQVCITCFSRKPQMAPRAGTPGFRPPEVLLKYPYQTTAVDIWAVGVIMLCILSRTYPFFKSPDDLTSLAEMITVFGTEEMKAIARKLGRNIVASETFKPLNLKLSCELTAYRRLNILHIQALQTGNYKDYAPTILKFPDSAYDLLRRLLELDPSKRITASEALEHPFITSEGHPLITSEF